jgi:hypothetical protein
VLQSAVTKWDSDSNGNSSNGNSGNGNSSNANNCNGIDTNGFAAKAGETDAVRCRRLEMMEVSAYIHLIYYMNSYHHMCQSSSNTVKDRVQQCFLILVLLLCCSVIK